MEKVGTNESKRLKLDEFGKSSKDGWGGWRGYIDMKRAKLLQQQQTSESVNDRPLFNGIAIYVDGFTVPSADELKRMIISYGGCYEHYHNPKTTTHVIASCLPNNKMKNLRTQKIVRPDWIVDSIEAGKILPIHNYNLYKSTQSTLNFESTNVEVEVDRSTKTSFLKDFYGRSRLHHISTMGVEFRQLVDNLRETSDGITFPSIERLQQWLIENPDNDNRCLDRCIMHIDMDCFFVSVGLRNRSELYGKPVAVTHSRGGGDMNNYGSTSEIACCNYEARRMGVRNGSWMGDARRLCPDLVTIPYDFDGYKEVAHKLYNIVASYTLNIEAVSCDEMYVDCTSLLRKTGASPQQFAACVRNNVLQETKCTCSVGIARNFLLARLATRKAKPNGQLVVWPGKEADILATEDVTHLPGVGRSMGERLNTMLVVTCSDLQKISLNTLKTDFGPKMGQTLYNMCRGIDDRAINLNRSRHSVSAEINYGVRLKQYLEFQQLLVQVAEEVQSRLKVINTKGKTITLKMKVRKPEAPVQAVKFLGHGLCDNVARAATLATEVDDATIIAAECEKLFAIISGIVISDIRGVGIQVSRLTNKENCQSLNTLDKFLVDIKADINFTDNLLSCGTATTSSSTSLKASPAKSSPTRKQSPIKKMSPAKEIPFKYLTMDKHFSLDSQRKLINLQPECMSTSIKIESADALATTKDKQMNRSLCAKMSVELMASLFREWTDTFDVPLNDDLQIVNECIETAVHDRDLEKVNSVLQTLRRLIDRNKGANLGTSVSWKSAYNSIVNHTQDVVMRVHGGRLATVRLFSP